MKQRWEATEHGDCGLVVRTNGEAAGIDKVFEEFAALYERYLVICKAAASRTCYSVLAGEFCGSCGPGSEDL